MNIKKLSDIDFSSPSIVDFNATVIEIQNEGDGDKRPFRATLKLEDSGENISISSWKFENLETFKRLVMTDEVYNFEGQAGTFGNFGQQIRVGNIRTTGLRSSKKILKVVDKASLKSEFTTLINTYIPTTHIFYRLIRKLILENEKFWVWPAGTRVHHAYPGGLARHSINVAKNAISMWQTYQGSNLDIKVILAGSLLHDIGKISEYNQDGSRTIYGNLIPHTVDGYEKIVRTCLELDVDPEKDKFIVMLLHVILSHHEKLEFGAPVAPHISEAILVSRADALDATFDSIDGTLDNLQLNESSDRLTVLDGGKILKWH